ncbi:MAG: hypothetical protein ACRYFS_14565 [Janthinobacterium lividum]
MFKKSLFNRQMTTAAIGASLIALFLAGCGGGGGNDSTPTVATNSPFAGTYIGTFTTTNPQSGTLNVTVATNGTLTGSGENTTVNEAETISGTVANSGSASVTFVYPTFTATASGTVAFSSNGHLDGTLTQSTGGSVTIDLIKQ